MDRLHRHVDSQQQVDLLHLVLVNVVEVFSKRRLKTVADATPKAS